MSPTPYPGWSSCYRSWEGAQLSLHQPLPIVSNAEHGNQGFQVQTGSISCCWFPFLHHFRFLPLWRGSRCHKASSVNILPSASLKFAIQILNCSCMTSLSLDRGIQPLNKLSYISTLQHAVDFFVLAITNCIVEVLREQLQHLNPVWEWIGASGTKDGIKTV